MNSTFKFALFCGLCALGFSQNGTVQSVGAPSGFWQCNFGIILGNVTQGVGFGNIQAPLAGQILLGNGTPGDRLAIAFAGYYDALSAYSVNGVPVITNATFPTYIGSGGINTSGNINFTGKFIPPVSTVAATATPGTYTKFIQVYDGTGAPLMRILGY